MAHARLAINKAVLNHLYDPNVNLIDFGFRMNDQQVINENRLAIRFHVSHKYELGPQLESAISLGRTNMTLPESINEFDTNVIEASYKPDYLSWWGQWNRPPASARAQQKNPMVGGISISDENHNAYGTLGGLVRDRATGADMMLSNWHVLVGDWRARTGQRIYQPGRLDGGTAADTVATLTRDAMSVNLDAAVATLTGTRPLINFQTDLGPIQGLTTPQLGMKVIKSGRQSNVTYGIVTSLEGTAVIKYGGVNRIIRKILTIRPRVPNTEVSSSGDSGSMWMEDGTKAAIGLHFAGSDFPEHALALDMPSVLDALNIDLVTSR
jgi:endonuclease G